MKAGIYEFHCPSCDEQNGCRYGKSRNGKGMIIMPRYIDADAFKNELRKKFIPSDTLTVGYTYDLLCIAPTVEFTEVVRCRECKKHDTINCPRKHYNEYEYSYFTDFGAEFCEKGERGKQIGIRLNYD